MIMANNVFEMERLSEKNRASGQHPARVRDTGGNVRHREDKEESLSEIYLIFAKISIIILLKPLINA